MWQAANMCSITLAGTVAEIKNVFVVGRLDWKRKYKKDYCYNLILLILAKYNILSDIFFVTYVLPILSDRFG